MSCLSICLEMGASACPAQACLKPQTLPCTSRCKHAHSQCLEPGPHSRAGACLPSKPTFCQTYAAVQAHAVQRQARLGVHAQQQHLPQGPPSGGSACEHGLDVQCGQSVGCALLHLCVCVSTLVLVHACGPLSCSRRTWGCQGRMRRSCHIKHKQQTTPPWCSAHACAASAASL